MSIVLLFFSSTALAAEVVTSNPIFEAIVRLECKAGIPISYEQGPVDHLLTEDVISVTGQPVMSVRTGEVLRTTPRHTFPIETPHVQNKAEVLLALNSVLEARSTWDGWDGCTQYQAAETSHGINVSPTTIVRNGRCEPYESHLNTRVGIGLSGCPPCQWG